MATQIVSTGTAPARFGPRDTVVDTTGMHSRDLARQLRLGHLDIIQDLAPLQSKVSSEALEVRTLSTLPTAASAEQGRIVTVAAAAGVASKTYICLKTATDTFIWVQIATG